MKKVLALLLAIAMILSLAACSGKGKDKGTYNDAGYYEIFSSTDEDGTMSRADYDDLDWLIFLQLNDDGTGVLDMDDGDAYDLTWKDGSVTMDGETINYALAGGMLTLDLDGLVMIFKKAAAPAKEEAAGGFGGLIGKGKAAAGANAAPAGPAGTWALIEIQSDNPDASATAEDIQMLADLGLSSELVLNDDGTGELTIFGESQDVTWDDDGMTVDGDPTEYVVDGNTISLTQETTTLVFERAEAETAESTKKDEGDKPEAAAPAAAGGDFTPVEADLGDYHVKILSAESFSDHDDKDGIRFYFDFTNNSDEPEDAWILNLEAEQDGYTLVDTYANSKDDVPEYGNAGLYVQPGVTIRCIDEFSYKPTGGEITLTISTWDSDTDLVATFDPEALPGRPGDWSPELIDDPQLYLDYPSEGSTDEYDIAITGAEIVPGDSYFTDGDVIRVFFDFTNNDDEATSCWWATNIYLYQDGIQLDTGYAKDETDADDLFRADIEPGESVSCSRCWNLRSDSPVEAVVQTWSDVVCAGTFYSD